MADARRIRWGILGTLWISDVIAAAIEESDTSELVAIGSRDLNKAAEFAKKHQLAKYYADYQQLLLDPDIDAVYIGLPNHLHKEWIIRCAQAGKHILCEKPFVLDMQEAQEVMQIVKAHHVFCMEALMYRCHPFIQQLQALLESKVIGDIKCITATYNANIAALANKTAGGAIRSLGCYPVSLVRLLAKAEPVKMVSIGTLDSNQNDNIASAIFSFANGITATITTADIMDKWAQFTVLGTKGVLDVKTNPWLPGKKNQVSIKKGDKEEVLDFSADKSLYTYQIDFVAKHIKSKLMVPSESGVTWEHSLGNVAVLEDWLRQIKNPLSPSPLPQVGEGDGCSSMRLFQMN